MSDLNLTSFNPLFPMRIHQYNEMFNDQNMSVMDKLNSVIDYLNQVGKLTNDVVKDWNTVYQWTMNDGLTTDVSNKIETMKANGELQDLLNTIFNALTGDMTTLHTTAKDTIVNSINEVDDLAKSNQTSLAQKATKTFVTYKDFGAALDGVTDDTQAVINCHNYANTNNFKVVQNSGTIYLKSIATLGNPIIKTDTDLTGASILVDQTMGNNNLYLVQPDQAQQTITVTPTIQSQMTEDAIAIPALSQYEWSIFNVTSNNLLGVRSDSTNWYFQEPFTIGTGGALIDGRLLVGYTTGTLTLTMQSILDIPIKVRGAKILISTTDKDHLACVFYNTRSNVTFTDLRIIVQNMPVNNTGTYNFKNGLIQTVGAYNVNYDHLTGENASAPLASPSDTTQGQYVFTFNMSSKCKITNCHLQKLWGIMSTVYIKDMIVRDSVLNIYDNHWGMSDLLIENLRIVGNNGGIKLGWGKGIATIRDCHLDFTNANSSLTGNTFAVAVKPDLGLLYEGKIVIDNYVVNIYENLSTFNFFDLSTLNDPFNHQTTRQMKLPEIDMNRIKINAFNVQSSIKVYGIYIDVNGAAFSGKNITMSTFKVRDFVLTNEQSGVRRLSVIRMFSTVPTAFNPNTLQTIILENVGSLTKTTYDQNLPLIEWQDPNTATNTKMKLRLNNVVGKIYTGQYSTIDIDCFKLTGELNWSGSTALFNNVTLDNCNLAFLYGGVNITAYGNTNIDRIDNTVTQTINMSNSTISKTDVAPSNVTSARYAHCVISPNNNGTNTVVKLQNAILKFCEIIEAGTLPVSLDSGTNNPILLLGNVVQGTTVDQTTANTLYKTIKSTYAQPTVSI